MLPSGSLLPAMARIAVDASSTAMIMSFSAPILLVFFVVSFGTNYLSVVGQADSLVFVPSHTLQPFAIEDAQALELLLEVGSAAQLYDVLPHAGLELHLVGADHVYLLYLLAPEEVVVDKLGKLQQVL